MSKYLEWLIGILGFALLLWLGNLFGALPEVAGAMLGTWISMTGPVDRFFCRIKKAAMDASLR